MSVEQLSVVDAIQRAVRDHPDRAAIQTTNEQISYRQFGAHVDAFAARLVAFTAPGEFVGIEADRSASSIIAIAGALTAQRPFVVLDPRDSAASNRDKVSALGVTVLSRRATGSDTADLTEIPAYWRARPEGERRTLPAGLAASTGPIAYGITTSGSTGEPKCVLVAAEPLARMVADHVRRLSVGARSRTLQFARLTFDGCLTEILWTLTAGACLVVLDEAQILPGTALRQALEEFQITHLKTTPFALTATEPTNAMSLRHVINGGGACRPSVVAKWSAVAGFHNAYGLTETTVCNFLSGELSRADCQDSVPLGEIVGDCEYHLLPPSQEDGTSGDRGELVITGNSVAIGYLTALGVRRFVDDDGNKVYRTGDIVERRDGQIFFLQRRDRQLKVRGYRLDPGEIEIVACKLDGVVDAVVTAESHSTAGSDPDALVCYYQGSPEPRAMRGHLAAILDSYKVPSVIKRLDKLPYTAYGKVDRNALRDSRGVRARTGEDVPAGEQIVTLVRELTGFDDAGPDDNFFDIGGDSASTLILVGKLKELGWAGAGVRDVLRAKNLNVLIDALSDRGA